MSLTALQGDYMIEMTGDGNGTRKSMGSTGFDGAIQEGNPINSLNYIY